MVTGPVSEGNAQRAATELPAPARLVSPVAGAQVALGGSERAA